MSRPEMVAIFLLIAVAAGCLAELVYVLITAL